MATKRQAMKRAAELGCTIDDNGFAITLDTPKGMVLGASGLHWYDLHYDSPPRAWSKPEAWAAIIEEMSMGVESCMNPECDSCNDW